MYVPQNANMSVYLHCHIHINPFHLLPPPPIPNPIHFIVQSKGELGPCELNAVNREHNLVSRCVQMNNYQHSVLMLYLEAGPMARSISYEAESQT